MEYRISKKTPILELKTKTDVYLYISDKYAQNGINFDYKSLPECKEIINSKSINN